jgi:hypothetical protein
MDVHQSTQWCASRGTYRSHIATASSFTGVASLQHGRQWCRSFSCGPGLRRSSPRARHLVPSFTVCLASRLAGLYVGHNLRALPHDPFLLQHSCAGGSVLRPPFFAPVPPQLLGSVLTPGVRLAGSALASEPLPSDAACYVYVLTEQPAAVALVACQHEVARERAAAWARGVLASLSYTRAVVLGSMPAEHFRGLGRTRCELQLRQARSTAPRIAGPHCAALSTAEYDDALSSPSLATYLPATRR